MKLAKMVHNCIVFMYKFLQKYFVNGNHIWPTFFKKRLWRTRSLICTGKSFSEALIFASTNPQYNKRLFIESPAQYAKIPSSGHVVYIKCFFFFSFFWYSEQFMYTTCSQQVLSLQISWNEVLIQRTIFCHIVGNSWRKNKCF